LASQHSGTDTRRIAGVGADGGVVSLLVENRRSCYRSQLGLTTTARSRYFDAAAYLFGAAGAGALGAGRGAEGGGAERGAYAGAAGLGAECSPWVSAG